MTFKYLLDRYQEKLEMVLQKKPTLFEWGRFALGGGNRLYYLWFDN